MSDQSSESSCEWVVLNEENETDEQSIGNDQQSQNLELNYEAVCDTVSDSIKSSLSSEELEWQYEQFEDYVLQCEQFHMEDINIGESETESNRSEDSNAEDDIDKCTSTGENEEDINLNLGTSKIHCYKHDRNERLNYILNLLLALVVASAVGLGAGHFLGWSHKCFRGATKTSKTTGAITLSDKVIDKLVLDGILPPKNEILDELVLSENLPDPLSNLDPEDGNDSLQQKICHVAINHDITADIAKFLDKMNTDTLDHKVKDISSQNHSESHIVSLPIMPSMNSQVSWNELSVIEDKVKELTDMIKMSSINSFQNDKENDFKFEIFQGKNDGKLLTNSRVISKPSVTHVKDDISIKEVNNQIELLKQFSFGEKIVPREGNFTSQLRSDLNDVIQSLSAIALARLVDANEKHMTTLGDSGLIIKLYNDFQNLINSRITFIDSFVSNPEYKRFQKASQNYLQKMVYSLVDSVDYLMKVSFKTLNKDSRQINTNKFFNNVSKVIFNFNKKWEKNYKYWFEAVEKAKISEYKVNFRKENREKKRKVSFEKYNKNHKFKRNTMKL